MSELMESPGISLLSTFPPDHKLESIPYDEESKPYYAGEMITYWKLPTVQQTEDIELWR